jgi:NAD(P)H-dependent FMN reductase
LDKPKIGLVIGSVRENRFADKAANWFAELAAAREDLACETVDLKDYPLPFFADPVSPAYAPSPHPESRRWQAKMAELDGYVFTAAEYNRGPTGVLKNALDHAYREYNRKPVAFIGYGSVGGARAVEQLRLIAVELQMAPIRPSVHIGGADFYATWRGEKALSDLPHLADQARTVLDDLSWWAHALKAARAQSAEPAQAA